jgi:hypothetical protein
MSEAMLQLNMFGPSEPVTSIPEKQRYRDDVPVACERELLWPAPHVQGLGQDLLERLYGDLPRRTRLTVQEVCRRLRCGHTHVYDLIECGGLDALDNRHPAATQNCYSIYRYSLVRFLFNREFVENCTRAGLEQEDMAKCMRLADELRKVRRMK